MSDKMREEFEAWVKSMWPAQDLKRFSVNFKENEGEYTGFTVQHCWEAWQASRAAVVIDLDKPWQTNVGAMMTPNGVKFSIEAAGLKYTVKP